MQFVSELSNGRVVLGAGTIYGAIKTLVIKKWIISLDGDGRKKEYVITATGKLVVEYEVSRLCELYKNGLAIAKGEDNLP